MRMMILIKYLGLAGCVIAAISYVRLYVKITSLLKQIENRISKLDELMDKQK